MESNRRLCGRLKSCAKGCGKRCGSAIRRRGAFIRQFESCLSRRRSSSSLVASSWALHLGSPSWRFSTAATLQPSGASRYAWKSRRTIFKKKLMPLKVGSGSSELWCDVCHDCYNAFEQDNPCGPGGPLKLDGFSRNCKHYRFCFNARCDPHKHVPPSARQAIIA